MGSTELCELILSHVGKAVDKAISDERPMSHPGSPLEPPISFPVYEVSSRRKSYC